MHVPLLTSLLLLLTPAVAFAITGVVVDKDTGAPLAARIEVAGRSEAVTAGADGRFVLDLSEGVPQVVVVSHPGYYVQRVGLDPTTTIHLDVRLTAIVSIVDRVEVTATRAREGIDPASFTNVPQERVAEIYFGQDPAMLLAQVVPGLYASNDNGNGIGYSYFSIRGFGQARTRVMLNGAPLNDATSGELFFIDLADFMATAGDVQVQRGVFGLSGLGGAIDLTTAMPSVEPDFSVHFGGGSYGTRRLTARWESGLVGGRWAMSGRYSKITTDGYREQSWVDMWNYYFALARFGDRSRLRIVLFGGPEQTHLAYNGIPRETLDGGLTGDADRDRRFNPITFPDEIDNFFQPHYQLLHDVTFSDHTRFSQTIYVFQGDGYYDQFRASRRLFEYALPDVQIGGVTITRSDLVRRRSVDEWDAGWVPTLTREFERVSVEASGEVRVHRARHVGEVRWAQYYPTGIAPNQRYYDYEANKDTVAGALRVRYEATPRLALTSGLQLTRHEYQLRNDRLNGLDLTNAYTFLLPRAGAIVKLDEASEAYVGLARGMREPFFRSLYDPQDYYAVPVRLEPEDVWNIEAGASVRRPTWRARGNVYWMNFLNEIVYAGAIDDNGVPVYGNGARSRRRGLEVDAGYAPSTRFGLDATLSVSRNRFTRYREYDWDGSVAVFDGNRIAGFPGLMASVSARTSVGGQHLSVIARHVGRFFADNTERADRVNDAYTVVDMAARLSAPGQMAHRLGLGLSRLGVDVRLNNLFGERYTTFAYVDGGRALYIPAAGRNVYVGVTLGL